MWARLGYFLPSSKGESIMPKKFTYEQHKKNMLGIVNRPKQAPVDRHGTLKKLIETAKAKRARV